MKSITTAAALIVSSCLASAAHAEVVSSNENGFVTRDAAVVSATPRQTWMALISPARWWSPAHSWSGDAANMTLTPQGGGCFCEKLPGSEDPDAISLDGSARHMTVILAEPDKSLRMRGGLGPLQGEPADGVLTITLKPVDGGTRVLWEYVVGGYMRYDTGQIASAVDGVMSEQLDRLAQHLGRVDSPPPSARPQIEPAVPAEDIGSAIDAMGSGEG